MALVETAETERANRRYLRSAMQGPMLGAEHELELALRWRDHQDEEALHELLTSCGGAKVHNGRSVQPSTSLAEFGKSTCDLDEMIAVAVEYTEAFCDYHGIEFFKTYDRTCDKAQIEAWRRERKAAGE